MPERQGSDDPRNVRLSPTRSRRPAGLEPLPPSGSGVLKTFYEFGPYDWVKAVETGVRAKTVADVADEMDIPAGRVMSMLGLSRSTVDRKAKSQKMLSRDEASKLVGMASLVAQVQSMVPADAPGAESFNAPRWVAAWLERPMPALDNRPPADFMGTAQGQELVRIMLRRAESGVYS